MGGMPTYTSSSLNQENFGIRNFAVVVCKGQGPVLQSGEAQCMWNI